MADGKIHLIFFSDCPYYGGAEGYVSWLAQGKPDDRWRLSALIPEGERGEVLARKMARWGVQVIRYRVYPPLDPRLWASLRGLLAELSGDVLHMNLPSVYDSRLSVPAVIAKSLGYKRVVATEHLPMVERARRKMVLKMLFSRAVDVMIVNTEWNKRALIEKHHMPERKIVVIPNASPEAPKLGPEERERMRQSLGVQPGEVVLAIVARLTPRKGHRFLFKALCSLGGSEAPLPPWRLLVVGEGEDREHLEALARELGLAQRVEFLGYREDAREIMVASDVLVLPSLLETQPFVITEAMASSLPVVSTRIFGIPELVADGETGILVEPGQVEPLAEALCRLISSDDLRKRMGQAGRRRYEEQFTLAKMAARTYQFFDPEGDLPS